MARKDHTKGFIPKQPEKVKAAKEAIRATEQAKEDAIKQQAVSEITDLIKNAINGQIVIAHSLDQGGVATLLEEISNQVEKIGDKVITKDLSADQGLTLLDDKIFDANNIWKQLPEPGSWSDAQKENVAKGFGTLGGVATVGGAWLSATAGVGAAVVNAYNLVDAAVLDGGRIVKAESSGVAGVTAATKPLVVGTVLVTLGVLSISAAAYLSSTFSKFVADTSVLIWKSCINNNTPESIQTKMAEFTEKVDLAILKILANNGKLDDKLTKEVDALKGEIASWKYAAHAVDKASDNTMKMLERGLNLTKDGITKAELSIYQKTHAKIDNDYFADKDLHDRLEKIDIILKEVVEGKQHEAVEHAKEAFPDVEFKEFHTADGAI